MSELEILDTETCFELLGSVEIGRVGVTLHALPAIFPVVYRLVQRQVMFYAGSGAKLTDALSDAVAAFEADWGDPLRRTGWSVQLVGIARVRAEDAERAAAQAAGLHPWAAGVRPQLVVIHPERVVGRRLSARKVPQASMPTSMPAEPGGSGQ